MPETLSIFTDEKRYIQLSKDHYYGSECQCHLCRNVRDGVEKGEITILSHDGQHKLSLPRPEDIKTKKK